MSSRKLIRSTRRLGESVDRRIEEVRRYGWLHDYHQELDQGPDRSISDAIGPDPYLVQRARDRCEMPAAQPAVASSPVVVNVNINLGDILSRLASGKATASECLEEMVCPRLTDQPHEQPSDVFRRVREQRASQSLTEYSIDPQWVHPVTREEHRALAKYLRGATSSTIDRDLLSQAFSDNAIETAIGQRWLVPVGKDRYKIDKRAIAATMD